MWACPSRRPGREGSHWTAGPAGNSGGGGRCPDLRRHPPYPPTLPAWAPPSPPASGRLRRLPRGFLLGFSAGFLPVNLRAPTACHLCVKIEVHDSSQDGRGGTWRRVIRCAAARPPALPAPSLRASISLPAKTAGAAPVLLVKHLIRNGLWRCARGFLGCVLDFSPCSQGGSSLSSDRSRGASAPRGGRPPGSPRVSPSA